MDCKCVPQDCVEKKRGGSFSSMLRGLFFGGLVGAGAALLATPRSGMENREMIRSKSMEIRDRVEQTVQDTQQKAEQIVEDTRQRVESVAQKSMDQASEVKGQSQSIIGQQKTNLESIVVGVREGVKTYSDLNTPPDSSTTPKEFKAIVPDQPADIQPYQEDPLNHLE